MSSLARSAAAVALTTAVFSVSFSPLGCLVCSLLGSGSRAEASELPSPLSLGDLLIAVRSRNPELRGRRASSAAGALRPGAVTPEDPTVMLEWWQQPVDFSSVPVMLTLKQAVPWPSTLRLKREVAEHEAHVLGDEADGVERRVESEAKRAYFDLALAERSLVINDRVRTIAAKLVEVTEARYRVAKAEQVDLLRAQSELLTVDNDRLDLERQHDDAVARLDALLDRPADAPLGPTATPPTLITLPAKDALLSSALARRPEVRRAKEALAAAESRVGLAHRDAWPDLQVWAGFMANFGGVDTFTVGASTTLPLFSGLRRSAVTGAAQHEVDAARAELAAVYRQTDVAIREALLSLDAAARHVRLHAEKLIPLAELTLDSAIAAWESGRIDFTAVLEAARMVRDHHLEHVRFLVEFQRGLADLEQATGVDVETEAGAGR